MLEKIEVEKKLKNLRKMKHYNKNREEILEFLDFCGSKFPDDNKIQSQRITILIRLNRIEEALKICEQYPNNEPIQSQRITILIKLNKLVEALKICEQYPNNEIINIQKNKIIELLNNQSILYKDDVIKSEILEVFNLKNKMLLESNLLTNIYLDKVTEEEIKNSKINDYNKTILLIAYYEKNNKKKGIQFIKEKKKETLSKKELKTYNILLDRLSSNKIFDVMIYTKILNCFINFDEYSVEENKEVKENIPVIKPSILKNIEISKQETKEKKETKYITCTGKVVNNRNNTKEKISNKEEPKEILIKELFEKEIIEISKQIYLELHNFERQKEAIKAWDILEEISNSSVNDKKSLEKMIRVINKIFPQNIEQNKKKYTKYLL